MRIKARPIAIACIAILFTARAEAESAPRTYLDIPITQRVIRDGSIRYGVWVKVGERSVEAMLDTGSTGLRVLPSVFRGDMTGVPTDVTFGAGLHLAGIAVKAPIEIGSLDGMAQVEVVNSVGCVPGRSSCGVPIATVDSFLIGGDGYPSEGYSAILGIGLPFRGTDLGNPLAALGVKQWIVELPRPDEIAEGHLILEPDDKATQGFTMLTHRGSADADGCIEGGPLPQRKCGTLLFDTGAPGMEVSYEDVTTTTTWDDGVAGTLTFKISKTDGLKLDFKTGESGGLRGVSITPPASRDEPEPFILAGVQPFFTYDILYDEPTHAVGLMKRQPARQAADTQTADAGTASAEGGKTTPKIITIRRKKPL